MRLARLPLGLGIILLLSTAPVSAPVQAQDVGIAAIVNDQVISLADVSARTALLVATAGIPQSVATEPQFRDQVIHMLIDEKLQIGEAKDQGVLAEDDEVTEAYANIEKSNHMPAGALDQFLSSHGIDKQTFLDQLKAQISWEHLVHARYGTQLFVSDRDVDAVYKETLSQDKEPRAHVAEIYLPVTDPAQDAQVSEVASRLMDDIRHGAQFQAVARQFSQGSSAASGGDLGWLVSSMMPPDMVRIIAKMPPGSVGGPYRLTGGYYILALIERQAPTTQDQVTYSLTQVVFPLAPGASDAARDSLIEQARETTENARGCDDLNTIGKQVSPQMSGPLGEVSGDQIPPELRGIVETAKVAVPLAPVAVHDGISVFMVCGKSGEQTGITRDQVMQHLMQQRYENIAQRYLGDLRRLAYIDRRI